jgi:medium-chain acyl-[acyl-carrier-protein] hydrolase
VHSELLSASDNTCLNSHAQSTRNPWFAYVAPRPKARFRLFCLPYAGGSALIYRNWAEYLPPWIELVPLQLPGRGTRAYEPPFVSMDLLVDSLEATIASCFDKPFMLFGHSMGAAISFELAHRLSSEQREPSHLFLSGRAAPQVSRHDSFTFNLPEPEFLEEIRRLKGTPSEVLADKELLAFILPILRADFELIQKYAYVPKSMLTCPTTVFGGLSDDNVSCEDLWAWRHQFSGSFRMQMFPGDHFFLHDKKHLIINSIVEQLKASHPDEVSIPSNYL